MPTTFKRIALSSPLLALCVLSAAQDAPGSQSQRSVGLAAEFFPFALPLEQASDSAIDLRSLNDAPAGKHGHVQRSGSHFTLADGSRIRFWSINVGGPELFASSRADIDRVAQRLAMHGFNLVRFHHIDNVWDIPKGRSIWAQADGPRTIDPQRLDDLHYAVAAFKRVGIYSNINTKVSKELTAADGLPEAFNTHGDWTAGFPHQKRVDRFSKPFIEHQQHFARTLWGTVNPHTGLTLAQDPAVAFAEINNENSLLSLWPGMPLGEDLDKMPTFLVDELRTLWNHWLRDKYTDHTAMLTAWGEPKVGLGEAVTGEDTPWALVFPGPTQGTMTPIHDAPAPPPADLAGHLPAAAFHVTHTTGTDWHQQAIVQPLRINDRTVYTLQLQASADPARAMRISIDTNSGDYRNVGLNTTLDLTPTPKDFELVFTTTAPAPDGGNRIALQLGSSPGHVRVTQLNLRPGIRKSTLDPQHTLEAGNVNINPKISANSRADWLGFLTDTDRAFSVQMRQLLQQELGVRALLTDSQIEWGGITGYHREQDSDYTDTHAYYNHPSFSAGAWDPTHWTVKPSSMIDDMHRGEVGTLGYLASFRVKDRPFSVSEYDHPATNDYRAEMYPLLATVASLQDWDALYLFTHGPWADDDSLGRITGFFDNTNDPARFCFAHAAALIFRQGLLDPLDAHATLTLPTRPWEHAETVQALWQKHNTPTHPLTLRVQVAPSDDTQSTVEVVASATPAQARIVDAPAGPVMIAASDRALVLTGFLSGGTFHTAVGEVRIDTFNAGFGSLMLVPLDGQPLANSQRMMLTALSQAENVGMAWNADRTSVGNQWGNRPSHATSFGGTIQLQTPVTSLTPLAPNGKRQPATSLNGHLTWPATPQTLWYEVSR